jgi:DNA polymerase
MDQRDQLIQHLRFFGEIGATGVSRDRAWRARLGDPAPAAQPDLPSGVDTTRDAARPAESPITVVESPDLFAEPAGERAEARAASQAEALKLIRADLGECTRCKLHGQGRRQIVYGVGNPQAELMFIGEAPGRDEDIQGEPFVGRAGQLLTKMIESINLRREDVYIANVIKCRPPENRSPEPDEIASCEPFLFRQLDAIRPKVVVALGAVAVKALLKSDAPISRLRGKVIDFRGSKLVPTFHPAFLLRSPDKKREAWEDLKKVRALLRGEA